MNKRIANDQQQRTGEEQLSERTVCTASMLAVLLLFEIIAVPHGAVSCRKGDPSSLPAAIQRGVIERP